MSRIAQQVDRTIGINIDVVVVRLVLVHGYQFLVIGGKRWHLHTSGLVINFAYKDYFIIRRVTRLLRIKEERPRASAESLATTLRVSVTQLTRSLSRAEPGSFAQTETPLQSN
jgi:hypothetical protein